VQELGPEGGIVDVGGKRMHDRAASSRASSASATVAKAAGPF
jgi:hypothetical protein